MRFIISRASQLCTEDNGPPIPGAVLSQKKHLYGNKYWYDYTVEVDSIEDLLRIADMEVDGIIVSRASHGLTDDRPADWEIEIYDAYIE